MFDDHIDKIGWLWFFGFHELFNVQRFFWFDDFDVKPYGPFYFAGLGRETGRCVVLGFDPPPQLQPRPID
jgi:hypothetical protein